MNKETLNPISNQNSKNKKGYNLSIKAGWASIGTNLLLFGLKIWAGVISGSVALIADAWHTLSDSLSSIFLIIGVKLAQKPADKDHPFGHGRYELIATILIGCLLAGVSYNFFVESIERLKEEQSAIFGPIAIVVTIVSIVFKELLAQYSFNISRKTGSRAVSADGWHHRSDAISSMAILIGIILGRYLWWMDGIMGIVVSIFILYTAYKIIRSSSHSILGEKPSVNLVQRIVNISNQAAERNVFSHHVHVHNYVNHKETTIHIYLPNTMSIEEAHELTNRIEKAIFKELEIVATIHIEPISLMPFDNDKDV
ncbi:MAG: cation diffusion facilitator family transporter [Bacteroidales bacterium]